jgi:hypothetical protein
MFENLGIQWASTLVGCLAVLCIPIPICFLLFGKKLRQKSKFAPTMKPVKKDEESLESGSDDDHQHDMTALHATKSSAHHDLPTRGRTRTNGSAPAPAIDFQKATRQATQENTKEGVVNEKQE